MNKKQGEKTTFTIPKQLANEMDQENLDDEVLSDAQSSPASRPSSSSTTSEMVKTVSSSRQESFSKPPTPSADRIDLSLKIPSADSPVKVLVFNGKCSKVFKSTLEDCVEDCILEFPTDQNSIYISKTGQAIPLPLGSNRNSINSLREQSATTRLSTRSNRRRSSISQYSLTNTALTVVHATRLRQSRFTLDEEITEESSEQQDRRLSQHSPKTENEKIVERPSLFSERTMSPKPKRPFSSLHPPSNNRDHRRTFRLSDLVMHGPEYFAPVFNLPRQSSVKKTKNLSELDRIKQDLFHRYLWTQKPQVSCRILPIASYTRSSTFVL